MVRVRAPVRFCFNGQPGAPVSVRASETAVRPASALVVFVIGVAAFSTQRAMADEGGVSFWLPGPTAASPPSPACRDGHFRPSTITTRSAPAGASNSCGAAALRRASKAAIDVSVSQSGLRVRDPRARRTGVAGMGAFVGPNTTSAFGTVTGPGGRFDFGKPKQFRIRDRRPLSGRLAALELGRQQRHDISHRRHSRRPLQFAATGQSWASDTARSTPASATPISISRPDMNFPP